MRLNKKLHHAKVTAKVIEEDKRMDDCIVCFKRTYGYLRNQLEHVCINLIKQVLVYT